eukprot:9245944-Pyramimonas_sp.AAC.2
MSYRPTEPQLTKLSDGVWCCAASMKVLPTLTCADRATHTHLKSSELDPAGGEPAKGGRGGAPLAPAPADAGGGSGSSSRMPIVRLSSAALARPSSNKSCSSCPTGLDEK